MPNPLELKDLICIMCVYMCVGPLLQSPTLVSVFSLVQFFYNGEKA